MKKRLIATAATILVLVGLTACTDPREECEAAGGAYVETGTTMVPMVTYIQSGSTLIPITNYSPVTDYACQGVG